MKPTIPHLAIWLMWLALPFTALSYGHVWDRLPARMAVHFDANWQPNGWTSRQGALELALGVTAFLLLSFTVGGYVVRAAAKPTLTAWVAMAIFYVVLAFVCLVNRWVVEFNLIAPASHAAVVRVVGPGDLGS
jgi:Domain of unknown function (DUF1648)